MPIFLILISWAIVAFGQPSSVNWLCPLAACAGYALLWQGLRFVNSKKGRFFIAAAWFAAVQLVQLSWMTSIEYQGIYILFVYAALVLVLGAQFGALCLFIANDKNLTPLRILAAASLWTVIEWSRLYILCGFSLNPAGLALTAYVPPMQFASVFGIFGLSFLVIATNLLAYEAIGSLKNYRKIVGVLAGWAALAAFPYLFGIAYLKVHENRSKNYSGELSIALVQTGLLPSEKIPMIQRMDEFIPGLEQWRRILAYLRINGEEQYDLIVLPEAAVPFSADSPLYPLEEVKRMFREELGPGIWPKLGAPFARKKVVDGEEKWMVSNAFIAQALAKRFQAEVIAGMDDQDTKKKEYYNAALYFSPQSETFERYEKRVLLPLAEYLPFQWCLQYTESYGISEFFTPGKEAKIFKGRIPLSVSICYEETFPDLIREGRSKGASLLVNVTNDNYYPNSSLPLQHYIHGRVRAVENGCPLIRACNTGVTAAIDSLGRVVSSLEGTEGSSEWLKQSLHSKLSLYRFATLYTFWGDAAIIGLSIFILGIYTKSRKRNSRP